jgi:glycosyltransferase involved in cell wall biosynthesis
MYRHKKKWFTSIDNMILVTPSQWLADIVKQSFLKQYPVKIINNGIDLTVFHPIQSDFRNLYKINANKFVVLAVAFNWGIRKGLDVIIELAKRLDEKYQIVLVGADANVDDMLPKNIISIHKTQNQYELAQIYTMADLFINPTREDNYPTVNMESIACGTPVLTFRTGGSAEMLDETCGCVVDCDNIDAMEKEIHYICTEKPFNEEKCLTKAKTFDMNHKFQEYINLYEKIEADD